MGRRRWTDTDYAYWRNMYEDGATYEEIALEYGATAETVRNGVREVGGQSRRVGQRKGVGKKNRALKLSVELARPARSDGVIRNVPSSGARRQGKRRRGRPRHL